MIFLISFILIVLFVIFVGDMLKKHPTPFYIAAAVIAAVVFLFSILEIHFGGIFSNYIYPIFSRSGLSAAMFVLVMYAGAMPAGSSIIRRLMPIRGQLSILASILTLGHNASYGITYFKSLFTDTAHMQFYQICASICSLIMLLIMLPLFITSFLTIRKKMNGQKWKQLQRLAYIFYGLMYVHIALLVIPQMLRLRSGYLLTFIFYSSVFFAYPVCRILKMLARKSKTESSLLVKQLTAFIISMSAAIVLGLAIHSVALNSDLIENTSNNMISEKEASKVTESAASADYQDGTFTGTAFGYEGDITVNVTFESGQITDISFSEYYDDPEYAADGQTMLNRIISAQTEEEIITDVDVVSNATFTSNGVLSAFREAIENAKISGNE